MTAQSAWSHAAPHSCSVIRRSPWRRNRSACARGEERSATKKRCKPESGRWRERRSARRNERKSASERGSAGGASLQYRCVQNLDITSGGVSPYLYTFLQINRALIVKPNQVTCVSVALCKILIASKQDIYKAKSHVIVVVKPVV